MSDIQKIELFDDIVKYINKLGGKVKYKDDYIFWKILPKPLRETAITLGSTIWLPERGSRIVTLIHEASHLVEVKSTGKLRWYFEYLMPQSISLVWLAIALAMMAFNVFSLPVFIIAAAWLIMPLPSSDRVEKEARAYTVSLYFKKQFYGKLPDGYREFLIDNLCGWIYYKMIWRRSVAESLFDVMDSKSNDYDYLIKKYPEVKDIEEIING